MTDTDTPVPLQLPLIAMDDAIVLPGMAIGMELQTPEANAAVDEAGEDGLVVLVPKRDGRYARIGVVAQIDSEPAMVPSGHRGVTLRALYRGELGRAEAAGGALRIDVEPRRDSTEIDEGLSERMSAYRAVVEEILEARGAGRVVAFLRSVEEPGVLADTAGFSPDLTYSQKQELLETLDVSERLDKATVWARATLGEIEMRRRIRDDVTEGMEKTQREYILRRQLEAIHKELGEMGVEAGTDAEDYRTRIEESAMPDEARKEALRELGRLDSGAGGAEVGTIRNYLDWLLAVPWGKTSDETSDVNHARDILAADHAGLEEVKERILEYLAVRKFRRERNVDDERSGVILALVGPPGVGKTSLGESIAKALGREFVRMSLGGVRDEAEIRGHRRTYVGALPGRFVRALRDAGTMNPVILLDEVDKLGSDWRGDPSSAMLEVLDPAQNQTFRDHYLDVQVDLSQVLFLATANMLETIPAPLLDRLEIIRLDGYTEDEKVAIASGFLVPRERRRNGLIEGEVEVSEGAVRKVIEEYTREAGVRSLERQLGKIHRKAAMKLASGQEKEPISVDEGRVRELLGRELVYNEAAERTSVPGVATGLAVTGAGGDVLFVEVSSSPGTGKLTITGQLGDVMKESASIALSFVRSHAADWSIDPAVFAERDFHIHVPAGAVPKDGPSAGVTMTLGIVSLLTGIPVKANVGMTGEVTLRGRVLPIGGLKQKVLAAHRAGLTEVILPFRNEGDLEDVPETVREAMTFHAVHDVAAALEAGLEHAVPNGTTLPVEPLTV